MSAADLPWSATPHLAAWVAQFRAFARDPAAWRAHYRPPSPDAPGLVERIAALEDEARAAWTGEDDEAAACLLAEARKLAAQRPREHSWRPPTWRQRAT